jgi:hypothetical protein
MSGDKGYRPGLVGEVLAELIGCQPRRPTVDHAVAVRADQDQVRQSGGPRLWVPKTASVQLRGM